MIGMVLFILFILIEIGLMILSIRKNTDLKKERSIVSLVIWALFLTSILSPIIDFNIKWIFLLAILTIRAALGIIFLVKKKENIPIRSGKIVFKSITKVLLITSALLPILVFPQYKAFQPTGSYSIDTISYTIIDQSREEFFTEEKDTRKLTIQFWYPSTQS